jgi:hypothetical protein
MIKPAPFSEQAFFFKQKRNYGDHDEKAVSESKLTFLYRDTNIIFTGKAKTYSTNYCRPVES